MVEILLVSFSLCVLSCMQQRASLGASLVMGQLFRTVFCPLEAPPEFSKGDFMNVLELYFKMAHPRYRL